MPSLAGQMSGMGLVGRPDPVCGVSQQVQSGVLTQSQTGSGHKVTMWADPTQHTSAIQHAGPRHLTHGTPHGSRNVAAG